MITSLICQRVIATALAAVLLLVMLSAMLASSCADLNEEVQYREGVNARPASSTAVTESTGGVTYRIYDMFAEPWGDWWDTRIPNYFFSFPITSGDRNTLLFLEGYETGNKMQGIIYAPYRMSMNAVDFSGIDVSSPVFMPVLGPSQVSGDPIAEMNLYFQYLSVAWWDGYWCPTWSTSPDWSPFLYSLMYSSLNDGYFVGTTYDITLNRPAAEMWLGMPQSSDPLQWWSSNREVIVESWSDWIDFEGNDRLDIYAGFEDKYYDIAVLMDLEVEGDDVVLEIGHVSWGYEVLMTRWLTENGVCNHEPWYEDFDMTVSYDSDGVDLVSDAVCQFSLHAVAASGTETDPAWVWEPNGIDYVPSDPMHPNSDYDPYANLQYLSWNCGDTLFGWPVDYEYTPRIFELSEGDTLIIELPSEEVIGYQGGALDVEDYLLLTQGDTSAFDEIRQDGYLNLGHFVTNPDGGVNLADCYDPVTKALTINGPQVFDNERHWSDGPLYHGAPWIEFDVSDYPDPPASVCGVVTSVSTGLPLEGALVLFTGTDGEEPFVIEVICDHQGYYEATVPAGEVEVSVSASGYVPFSVTLVLSPGDSVTQDFALEPDGGTVFDVVMVAGKKSGRTVEWEFAPDESGVWYARIENHGLDALRIVVYEVDSQTGDRETVSMQYISFRSQSAPWNGVVYTDSVEVEAGQAYVVEYTPRSDIVGSYCTVYNFVTNSGHPASGASVVATLAEPLTGVGVAVALAACLTLIGLLVCRSKQD